MKASQPRAEMFFDGWPERDTYLLRLKKPRVCMLLWSIVTVAGFIMLCQPVMALASHVVFSCTRFFSATCRSGHDEEEYLKRAASILEPSSCRDAC